MNAASYTGGTNGALPHRHSGVQRSAETPVFAFGLPKSAEQLAKPELASRPCPAPASGFALVSVCVQPAASSAARSTERAEERGGMTRSSHGERTRESPLVAAPDRPGPLRATRRGRSSLGPRARRAAGALRSRRTR